MMVCSSRRGWEASRPVPKDKSVVLNVEQEHERRRRLDDEYSARLNKDRYFSMDNNLCSVKV